MNDEILKAMIRKYMFEHTSRTTLTDEERVNHIAAEARHIITGQYPDTRVSEAEHRGLGEVFDRLQHHSGR